MTGPGNRFQQFVFGGLRLPKAEAEAVIRDAAPHLDSEERKQANDALLARLTEAKERQSPNARRKELLQDPEISTLVNALVVLNYGWMLETTGKEKRRYRLRESAEELSSLAMVGHGSLEADAAGMMGAILSYDYRGHGGEDFAAYVKTAIHNTFVPTPKARKTAQVVTSHVQRVKEREEEHDRPDYRTMAPDRAAINADLVAAVREAAHKLPTGRREVAEFMIGRLMQTGSWPTFLEIANAHNPPVSKTRGEQLAHHTITHLKNRIEKLYPQLAEDGVNGWEEFKAARHAEGSKAR